MAPSVTIAHCIDAASPLAGLSAKDITDDEGGLYVSVSATDSSSLQAGPGRVSPPPPHPPFDFGEGPSLFFLHPSATSPRGLPHSEGAVCGSEHLPLFQLLAKGGVFPALSIKPQFPGYIR